MTKLRVAPSPEFGHRPIRPESAVPLALISVPSDGAVPKPQEHDFSRKLTRVIEPKEAPGVELATLEDAARFMGTCGPGGRHGRIGIMRRSWCSSPRPRAKKRTSRERQRRWSERYGVTIGCDDAGARSSVHIALPKQVLELAPSLHRGVARSLVY